MENTERNIDAQDNSLEMLEAYQQANFTAAMQKVNLIGELTNWRTNFKSNTVREKVLAGRNKILALVSRAL